MKKIKILALLLSALLCMTAMSACGEEPAEESDKETKQEQEAPAESPSHKISDVKVPEAPKASEEEPFGSDMSLEDLLQSEKEKNPYTKAGIAYLGEISGGANTQEELWKLLPKSGSYAFTAEIPPERWVKAVQQEAEVWCILPAESSSSVIVSRITQDEKTHDIIKEEVLYQNEEGLPILIFEEKGPDSTDVRIIITDTRGYEMTLYPLLSPATGYAVMPNGGDAFQFTLKPAAIRPPEKSELTGEWDIAGPQNQYTLLLMEDGTAVYTLSDSDETMLCQYSGTWSYEESGLLSLSMDKNHDTGEPPHADRIEGKYAVSVGQYSDWEFRYQPDSSPLTEEPSNELVMVYEHREPEENNEQNQLVCQTALAYYQTMFGEDPNARAITEGMEDGGILVRLYDDMDTHTATFAWYIIDPETWQGSDYMTGEPIDFSPYASGQ